MKVEDAQPGVASAAPPEKAAPAAKLAAKKRRKTAVREGASVWAGRARQSSRGHGPLLIAHDLDRERAPPRPQFDYRDSWWTN